MWIYPEDCGHINKKLTIINCDKQYSGDESTFRGLKNLHYCAIVILETGKIVPVALSCYNDCTHLINSFLNNRLASYNFLYMILYVHFQKLQVRLL